MYAMRVSCRRTVGGPTRTNSSESMTVQLTKPRSSIAELVEQSRLVGLSQPVPTILNAIPNLVLIVNSHREIVYANEQAIRSLNAGDVDEILGKRPGEAMHCDHAASCPGGCGTGEACRMCGAANAIFAAQSGRSETRECRILQHDTGAALDFRVSAIPLQISGQTLTLVALTDISHENRRRSLSRQGYIVKPFASPNVIGIGPENNAEVNIGFRKRLRETDARE